MNNIEKALDYVVSKKESATNFEELCNDAANIFSKNYEEYIFIWKEIKSRF